ncbi:LexA family protein [Pontibacter harenae]|uniref:LexA family protein n=1 Tax=Pontibacter harenae TaxID=2894083 RepID=UPI001E2ECF00|nr:translesion error-prone DNA polymerase V autoproteolytic subunit [Pontibacter harenae]MCC9168645.1 translesion error-prone DNA polymerase V autoproteolytic subunit [Pontibacter harenae]
MRREDNSPFLSKVLEPLDISALEELEIPFIENYISAGFPSPALDYAEPRIDIVKYLALNPTSTFSMRVRGNSMMDSNIHDGDIIVIDKAITPTNGDPVVCFIDGEFTVKTFRKTKDRIFLVPANPNYKPIEITADMDAHVWGVVKWILHKPVKQ